MRLETVQDRPGPRVIEPPVLLIEIGVSRPFEEQQEGYRQRNVECAPVAGAKRTELMPEVPTMKEAGVEGVEVPLWFGLLAPAATPREIVRALAAAVTKAAHSSDTRKRLLEQGAEAVGSTPEDFARQLREEVARWAEVVRISGARAD